MELTSVTVNGSLCYTRPGATEQTLLSKVTGGGGHGGRSPVLREAWRSAPPSNLVWVPPGLQSHPLATPHSGCRSNKAWQSLQPDRQTLRGSHYWATVSASSVSVYVCVGGGSHHCPPNQIQKNPVEENTHFPSFANFSKILTLRDHQ